MRRTLIIGIVLLVLATVGFAVQRIGYLQAFPSIDLGRLGTELQGRMSYPFIDIASAAATLVGVMLIIAGTRAPAHER